MSTDERLEIFCCYAHEDQSYLLELKKQLASLLRLQLISNIWYDADISPGMDWEREINKHLNTAQVVLLLVSPDFMASDYCYSKEMVRAIERHERNEARVIPVILRPVYGWQKAPFGKLQALPTGAQPVTIGQNRDEAFRNVAEGIHKAIEETAPAYKGKEDALLALERNRGVQQAYEQPTEYRVTNTQDGRGLWTTKEAQDPLFQLSQGKTNPPTCSFMANQDEVCIIEGPLLREPLRPGKYLATFRYKVHDVNVRAAERYLLNMEVLSHIDGREGPKHYKLLASRTLTTADFEKDEEYKDFPLDFEIYSTMGGGEQKVELCTISWKSGIRVTFDSVRLSRRE